MFSSRSLKGSFRVHLCLQTGYCMVWQSVAASTLIGQIVARRCWLACRVCTQNFRQTLYYCTHPRYLRALPEGFLSTPQTFQIKQLCQHFKVLFVQDNIHITFSQFEYKILSFGHRHQLAHTSNQALSWQHLQVIFYCFAQLRIWMLRLVIA